MNATLAMKATAADNILNAIAERARPASVEKPLLGAALPSRAAGMDILGVRLQNIPHAFVRVRVPRLWPAFRVSYSRRTVAELSALREHRARETALRVCGLGPFASIDATVGSGG